jgi:hypothetical protein
MVLQIAPRQNAPNRKITMLPASHDCQLPAPTTSRWFLLRLGMHGQVGRFCNEKNELLKRGERAICRTARGLEVGTVLGPSSPPSSGPEMADGAIVRPMTPEDELLWGHLQSLGEAALESCTGWLKSQQMDAVLLEVEPLMDGRTLYFHFLSEIDEPVQQYLDNLVALYEEQVRLSPFAQLLQQGCGPGCGTSSAKNGCSSRGGCSVCKIARACGQTGG